MLTFTQLGVCVCTNSHTYYIYIEKEKKEKVYIVKYKQPVNLSESHMRSLSGVLLTQLFHRFDNFQNLKKNWKSKVVSCSQLSV